MWIIGVDSFIPLICNLRINTKLGYLAHLVNLKWRPNQASGPFLEIIQSKG